MGARRRRRSSWEGAPYSAGADDVRFTDDLLDDVQGGLCVNPKRIYASCDGRGALAHYRVDGLGHDWPSRSPNVDSDDPTTIEATPIIWDFFQRHSLET